MTAVMMICVLLAPNASFSLVPFTLYTFPPPVHLHLLTVIQTQPSTTWTRWMEWMGGEEDATSNISTMEYAACLSRLNEYKDVLDGIPDVVCTVEVKECMDAVEGIHQVIQQRMVDRVVMSGNRDGFTGWLSWMEKQDANWVERCVNESKVPVIVVPSARLDVYEVDVISKDVV